MHKIITEYLNWYAKNFSVLDGGGSDDGKIFEIHLPFTDKTGSKISFYFQETADKLIVSDLCFTLKDMIACGFNLTDSKIDTIKKITNNLSISFEEDTKEVFFQCSKYDLNTFYSKFNNFIQSLIEIDSLRVVLEAASVQQMFLEEIKQTFEKKKLPFVLKPKPVKGSISDHNFDILIDKKEKNLKPIYIKVCGKLKSSTQKHIAYSKLDIDKSHNNSVDINIFHHDKIQETRIINSLKAMGVRFFSKDDVYSENFFSRNYQGYSV